MDMKNNKKANFVVSVLFNENTTFICDVDTDFAIQNGLCETLNKYIKNGKIRHFVVGGDDVINQKLCE
jgi:hypothetical protein